VNDDEIKEGYMKIEKFMEICQFPKEWVEYSLLPHEYLVAACAEFEKEYGLNIPKGGTEHWRYGAIVYLFKGSLDSKQLLNLLKAVIADPDRPMAGSVMKEIISHQSANELILEKVLQVVKGSKEFCVRESDIYTAYIAKQS
jgi:hypothetical protein